MYYRYLLITVFDIGLFKINIKAGMEGVCVLWEVADSRHNYDLQ
jgi:hypothetical protein